MPIINFNSRWKWWLLIGLTTAWLLWLTLRPDRYFNPNQLNLIPLAEHGGALSCLIHNNCFSSRRAFWFLLIDVIGNMVVFMPLGFGLAGALRQATWPQTLRLAAMGGFGLSLTIELFQLTIPSRTTDIDDLIFNTLGAVIGALVFILLLPANVNKLTKRKAAGDG